MPTKMGPDGWKNHIEISKNMRQALRNDGFTTELDQNEVINSILKALEKNHGQSLEDRVKGYKQYVDQAFLKSYQEMKGPSGKLIRKDGDIVTISGRSGEDAAAQFIEKDVFNVDDRSQNIKKNWLSVGTALAVTAVVAAPMIGAFLATGILPAMLAIVVPLLIGLAAGVASGIAVHAKMSKGKETLIENCAKKWVEKMHDAVKEDTYSAGSTLSAVIETDEHIALVALGDSPIYIVTDHGIVGGSLETDASGKITDQLQDCIANDQIGINNFLKYNGEFKQKRSDGGTVSTDGALGDHKFKNVDGSQLREDPRIVILNKSDLKKQFGEKISIFCASDGFTDNILNTKKRKECGAKEECVDFVADLNEAHRAGNFHDTFKDVIQRVQEMSEARVARKDEFGALSQRDDITMLMRPISSENTNEMKVDVVMDGHGGTDVAEKLCQVTDQLFKESVKEVSQALLYSSVDKSASTFPPLSGTQEPRPIDELKASVTGNKQGLQTVTMADMSAKVQQRNGEPLKDITNDGSPTP